MDNNQAQFINDMCVALDQTKSSDNNLRGQAESYIKEVSDADSPPLANHCFIGAKTRWLPPKPDADHFESFRGFKNQRLQWTVT